MPKGIYERKLYVLTCSECGNEFAVKQRKKSVCPTCQKRKKDKEFYQRHAEKLKAQSNEYRRDHREHYLQTCKEYYQKNKAAISEKQREYYLRNQEQILARAEKQRRARGEKPSGLSGTETIVKGFLDGWFAGLEIRGRDRKTVKNPATGSFLELDFYIPQLLLAIELHGPTHFKPIYGPAKFERQQRNDQIKREACSNMGITLVEIPLESGVHYDRCSEEHTRLGEYVRGCLEAAATSFRDDKNPEDCVWGEC